MKLVVFLNARHYVIFQNKKGNIHGHSWQFQVEVEVPFTDSSFVKFDWLEKSVHRFLEPYQKTILNEAAPFDKIEPLTENLAAYFFTLFYDNLAASQCRLLKLTLWENPTKGVEISRPLPNFISTGEVMPILPLLSQAAASADQKAVNAPTEKDSPDPGLPEPPAYDPDITRLAEEIEKKHPRFPGWRHRNTRGDSNFVSAALPSYPAWQILLAVLVILAAAVLAYYPLLTAPAEQAPGGTFIKPSFFTNK